MFVTLLEIMKLCASTNTRFKPLDLALFGCSVYDKTVTVLIAESAFSPFWQIFQDYHFTTSDILQRSDSPLEIATNSINIPKTPIHLSSSESNN